MADQRAHKESQQKSSYLAEGILVGANDGLLVGSLDGIVDGLKRQKHSEAQYNEGKFHVRSRFESRDM